MFEKSFEMKCFTVYMYWMRQICAFLGRRSRPGWEKP